MDAVFGPPDSRIIPPLHGKMKTDIIGTTMDITDQASVIRYQRDHQNVGNIINDSKPDHINSLSIQVCASTSEIPESTLQDSEKLKCNCTPTQDLLHSCEKIFETIKGHVSVKLSRSSVENGAILSARQLSTGSKENMENDGSENSVLSSKDSLDKLDLKPTEGNIVSHNFQQALLSHLRSSLASVLNRPMDPPEETQELFPCSECPWASSSSAALQKHIIEKHQLEDPTDTQNSNNTSSDRLKRSNAVYSTYKPFQCSFCQICFFKRADLKTHVLIHYKEEHLKCKICNTSFQDYKTLKAHIVTHKRKSVICEICGKTFTQAGNLRIHMRSHTKEKPFVCRVCGKKYNRDWDLEVHVKQHTSEKRFLCEVCGKAFNSSSNLARHNKVHTQEKPFSCVVCEKLFAHAHHLKKHYRIHTQEKPYSCEFCGKAFREVDYLKEHLRVHTKEKPYLCRICGKGFSQAGSVKLHQRVHTRQAYGNSPRSSSQHSSANSNFEILIPAEEDDNDEEGPETLVPLGNGT